MKITFDWSEDAQQITAFSVEEQYENEMALITHLPLADSLELACFCVRDLKDSAFEPFLLLADRIKIEEIVIHSTKISPVMLERIREAFPDAEIEANYISMM